MYHVSKQGLRYINPVHYHMAQLVQFMAPVTAAVATPLPVDHSDGHNIPAHIVIFDPRA